jgi:hypothetical protein
VRPIDARRLTPARRESILFRDSRICAYCLEEADEVDHIVPWSYRHDDSDENLVAACWLCNHIASNKVFDTVQEKKSYILKRKDKILSDTVIALWLEEELKELGPSMRRDVRSNCLVFEDRDGALRAMRRMRDVGFEVVMGTI